MGVWVLPQEDVVEGKKDGTKAEGKVGESKEGSGELKRRMTLDETVLPHRKHVKNHCEDSDNFLVLFWLV